MNPFTRAGACAALAAVWLTPPLGAQEDSGCRVAGKAGVRVPVRAPATWSYGRLDPETGGGGSVGLLCRGRGALAWGGGVEADVLSPLGAGHVLAALGMRLPLGAGGRSPWVRALARLGLTGTSVVGTVPAVLTSGRGMRSTGLGPGAGADVALGLPLGRRSALFAEASLRWGLLATEGAPEGGNGRTSLIYLPLSLGYEIRP